MSVLLRVAYDGTDFHGYASQPGQRTVQGTLESALGSLFQGAVVPVRAASRTDAGVHAYGQLVAFEKPLPIPPRGILKGLTGLLPRDVSAVDVWEESRPDGALVQPRFENLGKHYRYQIVVDPRADPFRDRVCWRVDRPLDVAAMRAAAADFEGSHDFAAFRARDCQAQTTARTMHRLTVLRDVARGPGSHPANEGPPMVAVHVEGTAFLKRMVRVMVGTLVEVGWGRRPRASIPQALMSGRREDAGRTAPPQGLALMDVRWSRPLESPPEAPDRGADLDG